MTAAWRVEGMSTPGGMGAPTSYRVPGYSSGSLSDDS